jgi:hypothetical protein
VPDCSDEVASPVDGDAVVLLPGCCSPANKATLSGWIDAVMAPVL